MSVKSAKSRFPENVVKIALNDAHQKKRLQRSFMQTCSYDRHHCVTLSCAVIITEGCSGASFFCCGLLYI